MMWSIIRGTWFIIRKAIRLSIMATVVYFVYLLVFDYAGAKDLLMDILCYTIIFGGMALFLVGAGLFGGESEEQKERSRESRFKYQGMAEENERRYHEYHAAIRAQAEEQKREDKEWNGRRIREQREKREERRKEEEIKRRGG